MCSSTLRTSDVSNINISFTGCVHQPRGLWKLLCVQRQWRWIEGGNLISIQRLDHTNYILHFPHSPPYIWPHVQYIPKFSPIRRPRSTAPEQLSMEETFSLSTMSQDPVIGPSMCPVVVGKGAITYIVLIMVTVSSNSNIIRVSSLRQSLPEVQPILVDPFFEYECTAEVFFGSLVVNDFVQGIFYNPEDCGSYVTCNSDNEGGIKVGLGLKHTKNICFMVYNLI